MKKAIDTETWEIIFALYYGQNVAQYKYYDDNKHHRVKDVSSCYNQTLHLKDIKDITDEDLMKCYHLHSGIIGYDYTQDFGAPILMGRHWLTNGGLKDLQKYSVLVDYLRAKGYALPAFGFTIQELIDTGVFRFKAKEQ